LNSLLGVKGIQKLSRDGIVFKVIVKNGLVLQS